MGYIILGIVVLAFVIIVSNITVGQQSKAYVIERLGAFKSVWGVGGPPGEHDGAGSGLSPPARDRRGSRAHAD